MGVEGVVFGISGDEAAEAELFESAARLLVLFCGKECGTQSLFQYGMECRVDHDGLYRVGAPGLDHAQLIAEGRGASRKCILKTLESIAAASALPLRTASIEFRWDPEQSMLSKKLSSAPDSASLFKRL